MIKGFLLAGLIAAALAIYAPPSRGASPSAKDEAKVKPACVGIVDGAEWAKCMEKFKSIRPQHEPTKLIFDSYK